MLNHLSHRQRHKRKEHDQFIAQEIHDGACQFAVAAKTAFEAYRRKKTETGQEDSNQFEMGLACLDSVIDELRRLVQGLQPMNLAIDGLPMAIEQFIKKFQTTNGPEIEFHHELDADQIPHDLRLAAFRIVQESLANACRHSKSKRLYVELALDRDVLRIQIRDWGVGINPESTSPGHFGLEGIRCRAKLLKGTATIDSEAGKGTCVTVELPLVSGHDGSQE